MAAQLAPALECAVLFADLTGSTSLYQRLGDAAAFLLVKRSLDLMGKAVLRAGGRVVKITGDGIMASFWNMEDAAAAVIEIHNTVRQRPPLKDSELGVRIGFHFGPVVESGSDLFGDTVNLAARMSELAVPGKAILTGAAAKRLGESWGPYLRPGLRVSVKGMSQPVELVEFVCDLMADSTTVGDFPVEHPGQAQLRLYAQGKPVVCSAERPRLRLGRDPKADVVLSTTRTSRLHGEIELRADKFILTDRSSNGTFVTVEGELEFVLRHQETVLRGHGWLSLGQPRDQSDESVEFFCL